MASANASTSSEQDEGAAIPLQIAYRGQTHVIEISTSDSIADLQGRIANLTQVAIVNQKLLGSAGNLRRALAKAKGSRDDKTLAEIGFSSMGDKSARIMVLGPTDEELEDVQKHDEEAEKRNRPRQYHPSMLRGSKPRSTATPSVQSPFSSLKVHPISSPGSKEYEEVMSRLHKLSSDPGVHHVCRLHGFQVGELTELLPHEHPNLLGLNENMGQRISLRLRTQKYDGLINYREVRRVLLHELAHNKVNDHPPEFKILNSELNAQVEAYERQVKQGTHSLLDTDVYVPSEPGSNEQDSTQVTSHVLGGKSGGIPLDLDDGDVQSKRQKILLATMKRLEQSEAELEKSCGTTG